MEEREDDEISSTSTDDRCSSSLMRDEDRSPLSSTNLCKMANWNTGAFAAWQNRLHAQRGEVDEHNTVPHDSLTCESEENPLESSQNPHDFTSQEEFMRLMNSPLPSMPSLNGEVRGNVFSCPTAFRNPLPAPTRPLAAPFVQGVSFSEPAQVWPTENGATVELKKKRPRKKAVAKKAKKAKPVVELSDEEGEGDGDQGGIGNRWTDPEVQQLISFRLEMDEEFDRNAKKQGINSWDKIQNLMIAACEGFTKSSEACRNKWKTVFRQYCNDKRLLQISGEGRKVTCKFFEEIDEGFNNAANVKKFVHHDARGTDNPCPLECNNGAEGQGSGESNDVSPSDGRTTEKDISSHSNKATKKTSAEVSADVNFNLLRFCKSQYSKVSRVTSNDQKVDLSQQQELSPPPLLNDDDLLEIAQYYIDNPEEARKIDLQIFIDNWKSELGLPY